MSLAQLVDIFYVLSTFLLENALTLNGNEKNSFNEKSKTETTNPLWSF